MANNGAFDPETDGLTPGEQHVLALIREGRLDAEIAVRLGVSIGDVKDRIQRILRKLDLSERSDLRNPTAERRVPAPHAEVIIDATGSTNAVPPRPDWPALMAKVAAAAVLLGVATLAAAWAWSLGEPAAGEAGDSSTRAQTTPVPGEATRDAVILDGPFSVTVTPTVFAVNGIAAPQMTVTERAIFPDDMVLFVLNTGIAPDPGQGTGLFRVYRLEGKTYSDRIFPPPAGTAVILNAAATADGSDIVIAVCSRGSCLGRNVDPDAVATYYRSRDGGTTWALDFMMARGTGVYGVSNGRYLVMRAEATTTARWLVVEDGRPRELTPPTLNLRYTPQRPYLGSDGKVVWLTDSAVLDEDGRFLFSLPVTGMITLTPNPRGWVVSVVSSGGSPPLTFLVQSQGVVLHAFSTPGMLFPASFWDSALGAGTANAGSSAAIGSGLAGSPGQRLPVIINFGINFGSEGTLQVLTDPFVEPPFRGQSNQVIAARFEAFVRVNTPGDCLNIRERPSAEAPVLACVPDGVLLSATGLGPPPPPGFLPVQMPGGPFGFAATDYLLR